MMTLSKAIQCFEEKSADENCCYRAEYAQLAEWLKELALRRTASLSGFSAPMYNPFDGLNNMCYAFQNNNGI